MSRGRATAYFILFTLGLVGAAALLGKGGNISDYNYLPFTETSSLIAHNFYTLSYNEKNEQPDWVFYKIDATRGDQIVERTDRFKSDDSISTGSAANQDYYRSGYDRGHLAPAADMSFSELAMEESFLYSNISPQLPGFNRGIWRVLEDDIRINAIDSDSTYIFTGPFFTNEGKRIGPNEVSIPDGFYKITILFKSNRMTSKSWLIPHLDNLKETENFRVSIDSIESVTGIDFFYKLPDRVEERLEKQKS